MAKKIYHLEDVSNVDTRSDTTRQGYHEGTIPYGAGNVKRSPFDAFDTLLAQGDATDSRSFNYNPNAIRPITGVAPTPTLSGFPAGFFC